MSLNCESYLPALNGYITVLSFVSSFTMTILCCQNLNFGQGAILLTLGIACSDLVYSLSNILSFINGFSEGALCYIEAILREWSFNFSLFFVVAMAIFFWRSTIGEDPDQRVYVKKVVKFGTILCLALTLQIIWFGQYVTVENIGSCCFISYNDNISDAGKYIVRTIYECIPDLLCIGISLFCYYRTFKFLINTAGREKYENFQRFGYTFVMCLILLPGLIDNYYRVRHTNCEKSWLVVLHIVLTHSAGTLNALVYGWQQRSLIKKTAMLLQSGTSRNETR